MKGVVLQNTKRKREGGVLFWNNDMKEKEKKEQGRRAGR
jgi:hypothetical protein